MVLYECIRCLKSYRNKYDYNRHLNRKYPCKIVDIKYNNIDDISTDNIKKQKNIQKLPPKLVEITAKLPPKTAKTGGKLRKKNNKNFICEYCNSTFTRLDSLKRHKNYRCKIKKELIIHDNLLKKINKQNNEIIKLKCDTININSNNIINSNNTTNIKVLAFGKEDLTKLTDEVLKRIFNKGFQSVPELIKFLHFNENIPENQNLYISNMRSNEIHLYNGKQYIIEDKDDIIDSLYDDKAYYLEEKYEDYKNLPNRIKKKFIRFIENKDDEKHKSKLQKTIKKLIYNNRKMVIKTRKEIEK
jgi:hypothetical protein